jgi:hypothetical protein
MWAEFAEPTNPETHGPCHELIDFKMSSLRLISSVVRRATTFSIARRGYADAVSDKLKLSLALPHKVCGRLATKFSADLDVSQSLPRRMSSK